MLQSTLRNSRAAIVMKTMAIIAITSSSTPTGTYQPSQVTPGTN